MKKAYRGQRGLLALETLVQDLRFGARMLRRTPGFTAAALVTLALGIGLNTAVFSVVDAVLLKPLPFADPDRLVAFGDRDSAGDVSNVGFATWADYRDRATAFEQTVLVRSWAPTLVVKGQAERVPAMRVSWNYFEMLGATTALGRTFNAEEDHPDRWRVVVISHALWQQRFGGDPSIIGRQLRMNDRDYQVVGVLAPGFQELVSQSFYQRAEMWAPLGYASGLPYACRSCQHLRPLARLRRGVSVDQATAQLTAIREDLRRQYPSEYPRGDVQVTRLAEVLTGSSRSLLFILLGAVGFVLLIACVNVANLLLARGMRRGREMAVRTALGAGRTRLLRQLVTETLLLAGAGGALGVAVAAFALRALPLFAPATLLRLDRVRLDPVVLAFAAAVTLLTGLIFAIAPAMRTASVSLLPSLGSDSRTTTGGHDRFRRLLAASELAIAFILLSGALLMLKTVARVVHVDPGFDPRGVMTMQYSLVGEAYAQDPAVVAFTDRLVERVSALPGVEGAAAAGQVPMGGNGDTWGLHVEGRIPANPSEGPSVERYSVTPDYFRVMRIPLESGRLFTAADAATAPPVVILGATTARQLFPGENPIGHRVRIGGPTTGPWRTIVGIAGDVRHTGLAAPPTMQMYLPQAQVTDSFVVLTVRTSSLAPETLTAPIRAIIRELDATVPVYQVARLDELVGATVAPRRFVLRLLSLFAGLAMLLAAVGLYGVVSYSVAQRTREVGLRMALGATPRDIIRLTVGGGVTTIASGLVAGAIGAAVLAHFLESQLFDVAPRDPAALAGACAALAGVALCAHWLPARRAAKVDPTVALRCD